MLAVIAFRIFQLLFSIFWIVCSIVHFCKERIFFKKDGKKSDWANMECKPIGKKLWKIFGLTIIAIVILVILQVLSLWWLLTIIVLFPFMIMFRFMEVTSE